MNFYQELKQIDRDAWLSKLEHGAGKTAYCIFDVVKEFCRAAARKNKFELEFSIEFMLEHDLIDAHRELLPYGRAMNNCNYGFTKHNGNVELFKFLLEEQGLKVPIMESKVFFNDKLGVGYAQVNWFTVSWK